MKSGDFVTLNLKDSTLVIAKVIVGWRNGLVNCLRCQRVVESDSTLYLTNEFDDCKISSFVKIYKVDKQLSYYCGESDRQSNSVDKFNQDLVCEFPQNNSYSPEKWIELFWRWDNKLTFEFVGPKDELPPDEESHKRFRMKSHLILTPPF